MKFNIGGVNVKKVFFFYSKNLFKVDFKQINVFFSNEETKKFNIYTSYNKLHCYCSLFRTVLVVGRAYTKRSDANLKYFSSHFPIALV